MHRGQVSEGFGKVSGCESFEAKVLLRFCKGLEPKVLQLSKVLETGFGEGLGRARFEEAKVWEGRFPLGFGRSQSYVSR